MKWQAVVSLLISFTFVQTEIPSLQHDKTIEAIYQYVGDEPKTLCKSKLEEIISNPKTSIPCKVPFFETDFLLFDEVISVAKRKACLRQKRHRAGSVSLFCEIVSSLD